MRCPSCEELQQRIAELEATVARQAAQIEKLLAALERAERRGKRQAAPFSKGDPSSDPKRPGRKPGEKYGRHARRAAPAPHEIDEVHEASLPDACPGCGGSLTETAVEQQYQVEIPRRPIHRQFNVHVSQCDSCGKRVQGRHALQTSDALGAAACQIGPDAQAAMGLLNKHAGLSHGKIESLFVDLFGIDIDRSTSVRTILRMGQKLEPTYEQIAQAARQSPMVVLDETGWRVGGKKAWLHVAAHHDAVYYGILPDRSAAFAETLLGIDWSGTMVHDGWSPYDNFFNAVHQQCLAHPMRRAKELLEVASGAAARFPRQTLDLFKEALALRDDCQNTLLDTESMRAAADVFTERLVRITRPLRVHLGNEKFAAHLERHASHWFAFLVDPIVPATNWLAEQAIRPAVVNRKVWGGNRTWIGAKAQAVISSVLQTCRKQARPLLDFVSQTLRATPLQLPLPILATR